MLWISALGFLVAVTLYPVSTRLTRTAGVVLFAFVWFGLLGLLWRQKFGRFAWIGVTLLIGLFFALPITGQSNAEVLRANYVEGMRRYDGTTYFWGGESPRGIDCSGLIRRGLVDSLVFRGVQTLNSSLVRHGLHLWWNDCTAKILGEARDGRTIGLFEAPSINAIDHSKLVPGDMAVTQDGLHILAYLGSQQWIEADPNIGRVITVSVPEPGNSWFKAPVRVVRWQILADPEAVYSD